MPPLAGGHLLVGIESEDGCAPKRADLAAVELRADRFAGVFNHGKPAPVGGAADLVHARGTAEDMNRKDCDRPVVHRRVDRIRIDIETVFVDVDKHRRSVLVEDAIG
ncbi:hypothetical protein ACVJF1_006982 [Bradyrhizobium diazoefficiens]